MKGYHAAALALVGWYLMSPLVDHKSGAVIYEAPLGYWQIEGSFDTATECKRGQEDDVRLMTKLTYRKQSEAALEKYEAQEDGRMKWPPGTTRKSRDLGLRSALAEECIATDDPRLKEK
jgi:hypothetical protein